MVDRRLALELHCLTSVQSYADQIRSESMVLVHLGIPGRAERWPRLTSRGGRHSILLRHQMKV
jgi:hypothetical protein